MISATGGTNFSIEGSPFQPPFAVYQISTDSFIVDPNFSLQYHAGIAPVDTLYVDISVGSSGDGQSWGAAYKGVDEAIAAANSSGSPTQIRVAGGWYFDQHSSNAVSPIVPIEMIGDTTQGTRDTVFLTTDLRDVVGSWTGVSNYYWALLTTEPERVFDRKFVDSYGDSLMTLTERASISLVNSNANSWYWSGDTIYIRTSDSRAPDAKLIFAKDDYNFSLAKDSIKVYLKDLYFVGGGISFGLGGGQKGESGLYIENITTEGTGYGLTGGKVDEVFLFNSRFSKTDVEDIISYGDSSNIIEYNLSVYNGSELNAACTTCNASTSHGSDIIRVDGNYHHTKGPIIADVLGANSFNFGVIADSSLVTSPADARGFYFGSDVDSLRAFYVLQGSKTRQRTTASEGIIADGNNVYVKDITVSAATNYNEANGGQVLDLNKVYLPTSQGQASSLDLSNINENQVIRKKNDRLANSTISSDLGKVGINTNSPTAPLHVTRNADSPNGAQILIEDTSQDAVLSLKTDPTRFSLIHGDNKTV